MMKDRLVFRTCNVCEAMCGMAITVSDGRITGIRPDEADVFSRGHICPKGPAMREVLEDPDRLRHPVRRTPSGWQRVSWDEAFAETATRLRELRAAHGPDAVGLYVGNPTVHNHGAAAILPGFSKTLRTKNRFDANSQDANPRLLSCMMMYGDQLSIPVPDVDRTDHLLIFGANPAASNGSLMTLGDVRGRLRGIRERGGRIVLIDPRRTETAGLCDEHHHIRPGGDAALLLAMLHVLYAERRVNCDEVDRLATGQRELRAAVSAFPPERVASSIGIEAATIRKLALDFITAHRAVAYGRVGTCQNPFGAVASWLVDALNVVSLNFDREGGVMFPLPAVDVGMVGRKLIGNHYDRWRSRVRGLPELGGQLPAAVMAEEMETPGPGQIRGFITVAGNPVLSVPNGERLSRALGGLSFMVSVDHYINETTRHSHLILPPVHALERGHYDLVFHTLAVRNTVKYSEPVVAPPPDGKQDWEILYELGMRLGGLRLGPEPANWALRKLHRIGVRLTPDRLLDLLLRAGPYGGGLRPFGKGLTLAQVRAAPHGIDLGPLVPAGRRKVRTADGRVQLAPPLFLADLPRIERWIAERLSSPSLVLIGRRHLRTNNSWMHNAHSLVKGPDRAGLMIHPDDAARLGLHDGQAVAVRSRVGQVTARAVLTADVMAGVVSLPHGYGHAAAAANLRVAGPLPGPNINELTDDAEVDPLSGTAVLNGVPVQVAAV